MSECKTECDCMVCRSRRHRERAWAQHNAGTDYIGIRDRMIADAESAECNWGVIKPRKQGSA
jgi:hypothetical protein